MKKVISGLTHLPIPAVQSYVFYSPKKVPPSPTPDQWIAVNAGQWEWNVWQLGQVWEALDTELRKWEYQSNGALGTRNSGPHDLLKELVCRWIVEADSAILNRPGLNEEDRGRLGELLQKAVRQEWLRPEYRATLANLCRKARAAGLPVLKELMKDKNEIVCLAVAQAAGKMGPAGLSILTQFLDGLEEALLYPQLDPLSFLTPFLRGGGFQSSLMRDGLRGGVACAAASIGGPAAIDILDLLLQDALQDARSFSFYVPLVAYAAGKMGDSGIPILRSLLRRADAGRLFDNKTILAIREEVIEAAGSIGTNAISLIEPFVCHPSSRIRCKVAIAAGKMEQEGVRILEQLLERKEGVENEVVEAVAKAAGSIGPDAISILECLVTHDDFLVRATVVEAAGKMGNVGVSILNIFKSDKDLFSVVAEAAGSIGFKAMPVLEYMIAHLASSPIYLVSYLVSYVVQAAGDMGEAGLAFIETLLKEYGVGDVRVRRAVADAAGEIGGEGGLSLLNQLRDDPDLDVLKRVATSAGLIGHRAKPILERLAAHPDSSVYLVVVQAAGDMGEAGLAVIKTLLEKYRKDVHVRSAVAGAAWGIGREGGLSLLYQLLNDPDLEVLQNVARSAGLIGHRAKPILEHLAIHSDPCIREVVAEAAFYMGVAGLSILDRLARDEDQRVSDMATQKRHQIGEFWWLRIDKPWWPLSPFAAV